MKETFNLTILQTSDLHGYVFPYTYANNQPANIGLAKIATLVNKIRTKHTILIDTGDTIQGSPLLYHHAKFNQNSINPMAIINNYMNYDYITIGNHEFNYGLHNLHQYLDYVDAKILNSNILNASTQTPIYGKPYDIKVFDNGFKVAIIGLTTHYIPNWESPEKIKNITFVDAATACNKIVNEVVETQHPDFVIVNYHGGFERDLDTGELDNDYTGENQGYMMIQNNPNIDLFLSGHQHRRLKGTLFDTLYLQPGCNGLYLGIANIQFKLIDNKWTMEDYQLDVMDTSEIPADQNVLDLIMKSESQTQLFLDEPIGTLLNGDLFFHDPLQDRIHKHPIASFINQVQLEYSHADISCCSFGNHIKGFSSTITMRDIISTYVFPNTLVVKEMDGHTLLKMLEKNAEFFELEDNEIVISKTYTTPKLQLYAYDYYDGITYIINLSKPIGKRIESVTYHKQPLNLDQMYHVVMNNYRSAGGGNYSFIKHCKIIKDIQVDVIEILSDYIREKKEIKIHHINNITIKKG